MTSFDIEARELADEARRLIEHRLPKRGLSETAPARLALNDRASRP